MIQIKDVTKLYPAKEAGNGTGKDTSAGSIHALDHISLHVTQGEWLSIMGPSGSGKSTLVNLIGCLDRPSSGEIWLDGQNVAGISAAELNRVRCEKIGFIFQQFHLIPFLTAVENVMLAQYFHSMTDQKEAVEALTRVGLGDRAHHLPSQLSGGEQQRVCIARALINDPRIILADEPTGNLDADYAAEIGELFRSFNQVGVTVIVATHDQALLARLTPRVIALRNGTLAEAA
jgi:putative ABC transport system ATP-binding protein